MTHADPTQVYRRILVDVVGAGDANLADELFADDYVAQRTGLHTMLGLFGPPGGPPGGVSGKRVFIGGLARIRASFPDWSVELHDTVADGDRVAGTFTVTATFDGDAPFMGFAPTGLAFTFAEAGVLTIRDGRAVRGWFVGDELAVAQAVMGEAFAAGPPRAAAPGA